MSDDGSNKEGFHILGNDPTLAVKLKVAGERARKVEEERAKTASTDDTPANKELSTHDDIIARLSARVNGGVTGIDVLEEHSSASPVEHTSVEPVSVATPPSVVEVPTPGGEVKKAEEPIVLGIDGNVVDVHKKQNDLEPPSEMEATFKAQAVSEKDEELFRKSDHTDEQKSDVIDTIKEGLEALKVPAPPTVRLPEAVKAESNTLFKKMVVAAFHEATKQYEGKMPAYELVRAQITRSLDERERQAFKTLYDELAMGNVFKDVASVSNIGVEEAKIPSVPATSAEEPALPVEFVPVVEEDITKMNLAAGGQEVGSNLEEGDSSKVADEPVEEEIKNNPEQKNAALVFVALFNEEAGKLVKSGDTNPPDFDESYLLAMIVDRRGGRPLDAEELALYRTLYAKRFGSPSPTIPVVEEVLPPPAVFVSTEDTERTVVDTSEPVEPQDITPEQVAENFAGSYWTKRMQEVQKSMGDTATTVQGGDFDIARSEAYLKNIREGKFFEPVVFSATYDGEPRDATEVSPYEFFKGIADNTERYIEVVKDSPELVEERKRLGEEARKIVEAIEKLKPDEEEAQPREASNPELAVDENDSAAEGTALPTSMSEAEAALATAADGGVEELVPEEGPVTQEEQDARDNELQMLFSGDTLEPSVFGMSEEEIAALYAAFEAEEALETAPETSSIASPEVPMETSATAEPSPEVVSTMAEVSEERKKLNSIFTLLRPEADPLDPRNDREVMVMVQLAFDEGRLGEEMSEGLRNACEEAGENVGVRGGGIGTIKASWVREAYAHGKAIYDRGGEAYARAAGPVSTGESTPAPAERASETAPVVPLSPERAGTEASPAPLPARPEVATTPEEIGKEARRKVEEYYAGLSTEEREKISTGMSNWGWSLKKFTGEMLARAIPAGMRDKNQVLDVFARRREKDALAAEIQLRAAREDKVKEAAGVKVGKIRRARRFAGSAGAVGGMAARVGRPVASCFGLMPLGGVMLSSLAIGETAGIVKDYNEQTVAKTIRGSEDYRKQAGETDEEYIARTSGGDALNEAWDLYEQAKNGDPEAKPTKEQIDAAYFKKLPEELLERLNKISPSSRDWWFQRMMQQRVHEKIQKMHFKMLNEREEDKEGRYIKIRDARYRRVLDRYARLIEDSGTVHSFALAAVQAEKINKAIVAGFSVDAWRHGCVGIYRLASRFLQGDAAIRLPSLPRSAGAATAPVVSGAEVAGQGTYEAQKTLAQSGMKQWLETQNDRRAALEVMRQDLSSGKVTNKAQLEALKEVIAEEEIALKKVETAREQERKNQEGKKSPRVSEQTSTTGVEIPVFVIEGMRGKMRGKSDLSLERMISEYLVAQPEAQRLLKWDGAGERADWAGARSHGMWVRYAEGVLTPEKRLQLQRMNLTGDAEGLAEYWKSNPHNELRLDLKNGTVEVVSDDPMFKKGAPERGQRSTVAARAEARLAQTGEGLALSNATSESSAIMQRARADLPRIKSPEDAEWFIWTHFNKLIKESFPTEAGGNTPVRRYTEGDRKLMLGYVREMRTILDDFKVRYGLAAHEDRVQQLESLTKRVERASTYAFDKQAEALERASGVHAEVKQGTSVVPEKPQVGRRNAFAPEGRTVRPPVTRGPSIVPGESVPAGGIRLQEFLPLESQQRELKRIFYEGNENASQRAAHLSEYVRRGIVDPNVAVQYFAAQMKVPENHQIVQGLRGTLADLASPERQRNAELTLTVNMQNVRMTNPQGPGVGVLHAESPPQNSKVVLPEKPRVRVEMVEAKEWPKVAEDLNRVVDGPGNSQLRLGRLIGKYSAGEVNPEAFAHYYTQRMYERSGRPAVFGSDGKRMLPVASEAEIDRFKKLFAKAVEYPRTRESIAVRQQLESLIISVTGRQ